MINQINDILSAWVISLAGGREPSFQMPAQPEGKLTVHLYLMELSDDARRHNTGRPPIQPSLRYLLTTSAKDIRSAHELLGVLLFSALENPNFEVEFEPASSPLWVALQTPPRPAFVVRVPLTHEWPPLSGYRVEDVSVGLHGLVWLYGQVVGPGSVPLAQARIDLENLNKYAYTDSRGRFTIPGVPAATNKKTLIVTARGCEQVFTCEGTGSIDSPVVFSMDIPDLPPPS